MLDGAEAAFCPYCGLPQLRVSESITTEAHHRAAAAYARPGSDASSEVDWPLALRICAIAALIGLLPCALLPGAAVSGGAGVPGLFLLPLLTISVAAVYLRRRPQRLMTAGLGARMGCVVALLLTAGLTVSSAAAGFVLRYRYHSHVVEQNLNVLMQTSEAQVRAGNPGTAAEPLLLLMRTPEWHAGMFLLLESFMALLLLTAGVTFGALAGAMLGARQRRAQS